jgi:hypothetical protein
MDKRPFPTRYYPVIAIGLLLVIIGVSCLPLTAKPSPTPAITVVQVNREVTRVVVQEVTRIVQVPVTVTPSPSPEQMDTPIPTQMPTEAASPTSEFTPVPADVTILIHTKCLYGPDTVYLGRYEILKDSPQEVIGRNADSTWMEIQGSDHKYPCWVKADLVKLNSGSLEAMPVVDPDLSPYSDLYPPPPAVSTFPIETGVRIFWVPVPMSEADYHGYLVEAWVCQGGKQVFVPVEYTPSLDKNNSSTMMAVDVKDEPGCLEPSSARIYTVNNQGYSTWKQVPWQVLSPTPTLTPTP